MNNNSIMSDNVNREEMDDIILLQWMSSLATHPPRGHRWQHERLDWDHHVNKLVHEKKFCNYYRMSPSAHRHLVRLLDPYLQRVEWNSRDRSPILVEHNFTRTESPRWSTNRRHVTHHWGIKGSWVPGL